MNKTLLKRLLFELLEELVHLEMKLQALDHQAPISAAPYNRLLRVRLAEIKEYVWRFNGQFEQLYQEQPLEEAVAEQLLSEVFPHIRKEVDLVANAMFQLKPEQVLPETELYLTSLQLDKLLPDAPPLFVIPGSESGNDPELIPTDTVLVEMLAKLDTENPLRWVSLVEGFTRYFCSQTVQVTSLLETLPIPEPKIDVIAPLLNLRLLGPGYYSNYVLNAYQQKDVVALWGVEPVLFQELNRFGLINKDLVILHQSIERCRQHDSLKEPKALTRALNNDNTADEILKVVEKVVPERLAFTEKSMIRSQLLEERLEQGMLISAVPMLSSPAQLRDDLANLETAGSIYPLLGQLSESPASPREIINAGWLYKLDQSATWQQQALQAPMQEGWELVRQRVGYLNNLLLKSIEISEVHRVLSHEDTEHLVLA